MIITWDRRSFEIDGRLLDVFPIWRLIREGGKPITEEQFNSIAVDARQWIAKIVNLYASHAKIRRREAFTS